MLTSPINLQIIVIGWRLESYKLYALEGKIMVEEIKLFSIAFLSYHNLCMDLVRLRVLFFDWRPCKPFALFCWFIWHCCHVREMLFLFKELVPITVDLNIPHDFHRHIIGAKGREIRQVWTNTFLPSFTLVCVLSFLRIKYGTPVRSHLKRAYICLLNVLTYLRLNAIKLICNGFFIDMWFNLLTFIWPWFPLMLNDNEVL